jgi:GNAT superfamily N-acetyltransferase
VKTFYFDATTRAIADLTIVRSRLWEVNRINVPAKYRGQGLGSKLLAKICEDADRESVTLELTVYASGPLSTGDLIAWYKRYGFREYQGFMRREPRLDYSDDYWFQQRYDAASYAAEQEKERAVLVRQKDGFELNRTMKPIVIGGEISGYTWVPTDEELDNCAMSPLTKDQAERLQKIIQHYGNDIPPLKRLRAEEREEGQYIHCPACPPASFPRERMRAGEKEES